MRSEPFHRPPTYFALDFYEGFRQALETLGQRWQIAINVRAYDTKRSRKATEAVLETLKHDPPDLILGPLYQEPIEVTQKFSLKYGIKMLNPLSENPDVVQQHPYSYLLRASYALQHGVVLDYADRLAKRRHLPRTVALIYDDHPRSLRMAADYKRQLNQRQMDLRYAWRISAGEAARIPEYLAGVEQIIESDSAVVANYKHAYSQDEAYTLREGSGQYGEQKEVWFREKWEIPPRHLGHVYVIATDAEVLRYTMGAIERRPDTIPLFTQAHWLSGADLDYRQMERIGLQMVSSGDPLRHGTQRQFQEQYLKRYGHLPSRYAKAGYETMVLIGRLLNQCGMHFQHPDCKPVRGQLSMGLHYGVEAENQRVAILRMQKGIPMGVYFHGAR